MYIGEALIAQGMQRGIERGMQQGQQESLYAVAANMLKEGATMDFIRRATGLPLETIQKITG